MAQISVFSSIVECLTARFKTKKYLTNLKSLIEKIKPIENYTTSLLSHRCRIVIELNRKNLAKYKSITTKQYHPALALVP
jgi:hypothetical protein